MEGHECSLCGSFVDEKDFYAHRKMEKAIVDLIKKNKPNWVNEDGSCVKCYEYYRTLAEDNS